MTLLGFRSTLIAGTGNSSCPSNITLTPADTTPTPSLDVGLPSWSNPPPVYPYCPPYVSESSFSYNQQVGHFYLLFLLYHQPHCISSVIVQCISITPTSSDVVIYCVQYALQWNPDNYKWLSMSGVPCT